MCTRFAAAKIVLEGMHPVHVQSPPTREDSTRQTDLPNVDANFAAVSPADPPPITIISYDVDEKVGAEEELIAVEVVVAVIAAAAAADGDGRMQLLLLQYCLADVKVDGTNASTCRCRMMNNVRRHTRFVRIMPSDVGML